MMVAQSSPDSQPEHTGAGCASPGPVALGMTLWLGVALGLVAGVAAWAAFARWYPWLSLSEELLRINMFSPPAEMAKRAAAQQQINALNPMVAMAVWGAILGGMLGLGEGVGRRRVGVGLVAVVVCALFGGLCGGLAGLAGHVVLSSYAPDALPGELSRTILSQAAMLGVMGGGVGLGWGVTRATFRSEALGLVCGALGGVLAAMLHTVLAAWLFPNLHTEMIIPEEPGSRLAWLVLGSGLVGTMVAAAARGSTPRPARASPCERPA